MNAIKMKMPTSNGMLGSIKDHNNKKRRDFGGVLFKQSGESGHNLMFPKGMSDVRQVETAQEISTPVYAKLILESGNATSWQAKLELICKAFCKESNDAFNALIELEEQLPEEIKKDGKMMGSLIGFWTTGILKGFASMDEMNGLVKFMASDIYLMTACSEKDREIFTGYVDLLANKFLGDAQTFSKKPYDKLQKLIITRSNTIYAKYYPKDPEKAKRSTVEFLQSYKSIKK